MKFPPTLIKIGSSLLASFLIGDGDGSWDGPWTSISVGGGLASGGPYGGGVTGASSSVVVEGSSVVIDLIDQSN